MYGFQLFQKLFSQLNHLKKKEVIEHIFFMKSISVYAISFLEYQVLIRFYESSNFYQCVFLFQYSSDHNAIHLQYDNHIFVAFIYLYDFYGSFNERQQSFFDFIQILLSNDEEEVYQKFFLLL